MGRAIALIITTTVVLVAGTAGAAAGGGGPGPCDAFGVGSELRLLDSCFDATAQFVAAGSELRVTNEGGVGHTITAADGSFDSGIIAPGESFEFTLAEPGVIPVYCRPHGGADGFGMAGVLIVGEPTPQADGAEQVAASLRRTLDAQSREVHDAVDRQTERVSALHATVASLSRDVRELRTAVEADHDAEEEVRVLSAGETETSRGLVPALIGLLIGGGLVAAALLRLTARAVAEAGDDGAAS
jgi:plastocyanin